MSKSILITDCSILEEATSVDINFNNKTLDISATKGNDVSNGKTPVYAAAYNGHTTTVNGIASESVTVSKDATSSVVVNE